MLYCIAIEQGPWVAGLAVIVAVIAVVCILFLVRLLYRMGKEVIKKRTRVTIKIEGKEVETIGPINGVWVVLLLGGLMGAPVYAAIWLYQLLDGYYVTGTHAQASPTLAEVRKSLVENDQRTRLKVDIKDAVKNVRISGKYRGQCLADLFQVICNANIDRVTCTDSIWSQTFTIDAKSQ